MKVTFGGPYKKFELIQQEHEIFLYNNVTVHSKRFLRVITRDGNNRYLLTSSSGSQNKKFKNYVMRRWEEFVKLNPCGFKLMLEKENYSSVKCVKDFLEFMKMSVRDYKINDIL